METPPHLATPDQLNAIVLGDLLVTRQPPNLLERQVDGVGDQSG